MNKFYITTPIYYVNSYPHLGSAYTTVAADVLARFHRMRGEEVFFLTGTDEHGSKVAEAAAQKKTEPQKLCDQVTAKYEEVWDTLKISYNYFIRTTDSQHAQTVRYFLNSLKEKGLIYKGQYQGLYCLGCERYYTEKELVDGQCPFHKKKPISFSEECYFFKLSAFQEKLLKLIRSQKLIIEPQERRNELLSFLERNQLEDLAVSRANVKWGIPLPWDSQQTAYVWIDALLNYLSGLGWQGDSQKISDFWPPDVQLLGKDILRFHLVIWPALLLALDIPLPRRLYVHGFFTINGQKMGKSLGNALDPEKMAEVFGVDALRWLMLSSFPFGQDGDISQSKFYDQYQAQLANGLGNLFRRVLTLAAKSDQDFTPPQKEEKKIIKILQQTWKIYEKSLDDLKFEAAIESVRKVIAEADRYVDQNKPWELLKKDFSRYQEVIYHLLEILRHLGWLIRPFMPDKSDLIFKGLNLELAEKKKSLIQGKKWGGTIFSPTPLEEILFPRL
ncbi:methionine--tRNA ligase [Patescibacteria group bacterium]|nr:methionine--tRNA ligase [Patescibacteria group bacterium]